MNIQYIVPLYGLTKAAKTMGYTDLIASDTRCSRLMKMPDPRSTVNTAAVSIIRVAKTNSAFNVCNVA
jgi:hypothetical protein